MAIYWLGCFSAMIISYVLERYRKNKRKTTFFIIIFSMLPLFLISALRYKVGTDYVSYSIAFDRILGGDNQRIEILYVLINKFVQGLGGEYQWVIAITSGLVCYFFFKFIYSVSPDVPLSVFLFVGTLQYFASLTNIRQSIGIAFAVYALVYLRKNEYKKFFLYIVIGTGFHYSIALFGVAFFLHKISISRKLMFLIIGCVFACRQLFVQLFSMVISLTKYATYFGSKWDDGEVSYAIIAIQLAIFIFASVQYRDDAEYRLFYNLQFVTVIISMFLGKIPLVFRIERIFSAPNIVLIPMALCRVKDRRIRILMSIALMILFMCYAYVSVYLHNQFLAIPYTSILNK